jgi:hypothetical protein
VTGTSFILNYFYQQNLPITGKNNSCLKIHCIPQQSATVYPKNQAVLPVTDIVACRKILPNSFQTFLLSETNASQKGDYECNADLGRNCKYRQIYFASSLLREFCQLTKTL